MKLVVLVEVKALMKKAAVQLTAVRQSRTERHHKSLIDSDRDLEEVGLSISGVLSDLSNPISALLLGGRNRRYSLSRNSEHHLVSGHNIKLSPGLQVPRLSSSVSSMRSLFRRKIKNIKVRIPDNLSEIGNLP